MGTLCRGFVSPLGGVQAEGQQVRSLPWEQAAQVEAQRRGRGWQ